MKTVEERIYECLGIKYFKKFTVSLGKRMRRSNSSISKVDNYFLHELSTDGIKDYKKNGIKVNSIIHGTGLSLCILALITTTSTFSIVWSTLYGLIHSYCIMLQRYNTIRLNRTYEKMKEREKSREKLATKKSEDSSELIKNKSDDTTSSKITSSNPKVECLRKIRESVLEQQVLSLYNSIALTGEKESGFQK